MFYKSMFWDGRAETLEEQATLPILNPIEMGQKEPKDVVARLAAIPEFVEAFQQVFGRQAARRTQIGRYTAKAPIA